MTLQLKIRKIGNSLGIVLPKEPYQALLAGELEQMPTMVGTVADEGTVYVVFNGSMSEAEYSDVLTTQFGAATTTEILARYSSATFSTPAQALMHALGDFAMTCEARRTSRALAKAGVDVYRYEFAHKPSFAPLPVLGAFHASDLFFFFGTPWPGTKFVGAEATLSKSMVGYWGRFVGTGDPNGDSAVSWPLFTESDDQHLEFDAKQVAKAHLKKDECDFWDQHQL